ncbi:MAG: hypothetical protein QNI90_13405 [Dinoroseobacter sp.]|nr:hypothetical protein [Dinoroseobacter sp.]
MDKADRLKAIEAAENAIGSKLPDGLRERLINHGKAHFDYPEGVGADPVFVLCEAPNGAALFADNYGRAITELDGWDGYETENWHYAERAFIALDNESGDYVLLAPDGDGVARCAIFTNHETNRFEIIAENIDDILSPQSEP